jgi:hypothetical protein
LQEIGTMYTIRSFAAALATTLIAVSAVEGETLDQSFDPGNGGGYFVSSGYSYAQTFTAGMTGNLTRADVRALNYFGAASAPLQLEVWSTTNPNTLASLLASASLPQSSVPSSTGFVSFDLSGSPAPITAGQPLALVLKTASNYSYLWEGPSNGGYTNGVACSVSGNSYYVTMAGPNADFGFRTYVTTVPEPSSFVLLGTSLVVGLAFAKAGLRRRFRRPCMLT